MIKTKLPKKVIDLCLNCSMPETKLEDVIIDEESKTTTTHYKRKGDYIFPIMLLELASFIDEFNEKFGEKYCFDILGADNYMSDNAEDYFFWVKVY
jgi:hypothetical protein